MKTAVEKSQAPVTGGAPPAEKKSGKEKKPKQAMVKNAKTASHPPYFQMIKDALVALKEKNGSSPYAIAKFMEEKHKSVLPANFKKIMAIQLKNSVSKGKLVKVKASYKLSDAGKKEKSGAKTAAKPGRRAKKTEKKSKVVKKKPAAAVKPKQPKSIKKTKK